MKKIALLLAVAFFPAYAFPQNQVKYFVNFNQDLCQYEAKVKLTSGALTLVPQRIPLPSNFTIVLPASYANTPINVTASVNPPGMTWTENPLSIQYAPNAAPGNDYHPFSIPSGNGSNAYQAMALDDELVLFRFTLSGGCGNGVRVFEPGLDPSSTQFINAGDPGADYTSSFKVLSGGELFSGNLPSTTVPPAPVINSVTQFCNNTPHAIGVNMTASTSYTCASSLSYSWTGPNAFSANTASFSINNPTAVNEGLYTVTITDNNGCQTTTSQNFTTVVCPTPLPVKLLDFTAVPVQCNVIARWNTGDEAGGERYFLEKSLDGTVWSPVTAIPAKGTPAAAYSFVDESYVAGRAYYRLHIVGNDNDVYSGTQTVSTDCKKTTGTDVFPTITDNLVNVIASGMDEHTEIVVLNTLGQVVKPAITGNGATVKQVHFANCTPGTYIIRIRFADGHTESFKINRQ